MSNNLKLSVNTSIYDGYDLDTTLNSIKKCGFDYFELAYNQAYVSNLNQNLFSIENANFVNSLKERYQLSTLALGCTMDLSSDNFIDIFAPRIHFAKLIGARYINVCTTKKENKNKMLENLKALRAFLEESGCILCLENGGDYNFNAFITIKEGIELINELGNDCYSINFDPGNMITSNKNLDVLSESISALDFSRYFHIKDVSILDRKFIFVPIGEGLIDYSKIIRKLVKKELPCSLEIPLRIYRELDSTPIISDQKIELNLIENVLIKSKEYIKNIL